MCLAGFVAYFGGIVVATVLISRDALPLWGGWTLGLVAILGLVVFAATLLRGLLRGDTEGVERENAGRAAMLAVVVVLIAGFSYALLEAFVGLPRLTAAAPGVLAGLVWMLNFAWLQREGAAE